MADSDFKQKPIAFPNGWIRHSNGGVIGLDKYRPDLSFQDAEGRVVCVIESSSTNDRKVGVGELFLADKFFSDTAVDGVLIFSLCGKSTSPPRPDTQHAYLLPYFTHLRSFAGEYGVKEIYIISEAAFESCDWTALSDDFKSMAYALKVQAVISDPVVQAKQNALRPSLA
jgi:hypothetical protein